MANVVIVFAFADGYGGRRDFFQKKRQGGCPKVGRQARFMESLLSLCARFGTMNSPRALARRDSVLDCGSPLPLLLGCTGWESAAGPSQGSEGLLNFFRPTRDFFERFFSSIRIVHRKQTIAPERNDMATHKPKPGLRPILTIHVLDAQNSPTAGLGSPTQAARTDSHRIPHSSEKARVLAVKKKSIPCVHRCPVHFLVVIRQLTRARANRFREEKQE